MIGLILRTTPHLNGGWIHARHSFMQLVHSLVQFAAFTFSVTQYFTQETVRGWA